MSVTVISTRMRDQPNSYQVENIPLSVYIHYPWCIKKCPYCDFNSHTLSNHVQVNEQDYLDALIKDLEQQLPSVWGRRIHSIFIGGGTPNLLSPRAIKSLLNHLRALLPLLPEAEITMEANPGVHEKSHLQAYHDAGVTRLSIGVQSLNQHMLSRLGRIHSPKQAYVMIEDALSIFPEVNADLMYGLPAQTVALAQQDIKQLIALGLTHISAYQLTLEPNTLFYTQTPSLPNEEVLMAIEVMVHSHLFKAGFHRYEISAFAKDKHVCRHNLNYWQFGDYLGLGAGAHGKITLPQGIQRTCHKKNPQDYIQHIACDKKPYCTPVLNKNITGEFMMNALRLLDGFTIALYEERSGLPWIKIMSQIGIAEQRGLLQRIAWQTVAPTSLGSQFLNELIEIFF